MAVLSVVYQLSEQGERNYLKTYSTVPVSSKTVLEIDPSSEWYEKLCDYVDLKTLTFSCAVPGAKSVTVIERTSSTPFTVQLIEGGVYIESDRYYDSDDECPQLIEGLLLAHGLLRKVKLVEDAERARIAKLPFDIRVTPYSGYLDLSLRDLVTELTDNTYKPSLVVRYFWTTLSIYDLMEKHLGWDDALEYAFEWPWDALKRQYGRALHNTTILTETYSAQDFAKGIVKPRTVEEAAFSTLGIDGSSVRLPNRASFAQLKSLLEKQDKKRLDFIANEGTSYLRHLYSDNKNYEHVLDREILTKKYPDGFLVKSYPNHTYKARNCPTPVEYGQMKSLAEKYPDLINPQFKWLEITSDEEVEIWSGPVLVLQSPYGFDLLFGDFPPAGELGCPLSANQAPYSPFEAEVTDTLLPKKLEVSEFTSPF